MTGTNGSNAFENAKARVELLRAVGLCHPGWNRLRGLTFSPDSSSSPAWLPWKERIFAAILWPRIAEARSAGAAGDLRALADCDQAIDSALPASFRAPSSRAGRFLLAHYSAPKSEKLWRRYHALIGSGDAPGHLATLCALRGAIFHLSSIAVSGAYIFLEAKSGLPRSGMDLWVSMVVDCLTTECGPKISGLRAA
jgi:UreF-like urease accessory protein